MRRRIKVKSGSNPFEGIFLGCFGPVSVLSFCFRFCVCVSMSPHLFHLYIFFVSLCLCVSVSLCLCVVFVSLLSLFVSLCLSVVSFTMQDVDLNTKYSVLYHGRECDPHP